MMRIFDLIIICLLVVVPVRAVYISEVYYDSVDESGSEYVEIYNPKDKPVNITGWMLGTETSESDAVIDGVIAPKSYFLVTDSGFNDSKDEVSWPAPNHEEPITLTNSDAGVMLYNGSIVDAVGWGQKENIDSGLYEGEPAIEVEEGFSIERMQDTDNNSQDFRKTEPNPQRGGNAVYNQSVVKLNIDIIGHSLEISNISIKDEDKTKNGLQAFPVPSQNKTISVRANVEYSGGKEKIDQVSVNGIMMRNIENVTPTKSIYEGSIHMAYYWSAGNYDLMVEAIAETEIENKTEQFEYMSLNAINVDTKQLAFDSVNPGGSVEIIGDNNMSSNDRITIENSGNVDIDIGLFSEGFEQLGSESILDYTYKGSNFKSV